MNTVDRPRLEELTVECPSDVHAQPGERRRAQRRDDVSAALVPLLRSPGALDMSQPEYGEDDHVGTPMLGILFGIALSVPLWCALGGALHVVFR